MAKKNILKRKHFWFILVVLIVFIGVISEDILGQSNEGGKKMDEEKKYTARECHKKFAIELNNLVWGLLEKKGRTSEEKEKMIHAAHASCYHWGEIGEPINLQRGEWMISHVYAILNRPEPALYHAKECMELTEKYKFEDFDLAYAYEAMARAYAVGHAKTEFEKFSKLAKEAGENIKGEEDRKIFMGDFESGPWYDMK